jgi:dihydroorotase
VLIKNAEMSKVVFRNAKVVNRGSIKDSDVLVEGDRIIKIAPTIRVDNAEEVDLNGLWLLPGIIDDQVHFREPGLTHKANIATESRAAAAGGVTSFMEMPNTKPAAITQPLLQDKYDIAANTSTVNYSFFMGASNDNLEEVLKTNHQNVCGVKIFMGSSTGNMLVDETATLEGLFSKVDMLIATHCEDEETVRAAVEKAKQQSGDKISAVDHPIIRGREACYLSSSMAVELAKKYGTKLHILHLTTAEELKLFSNKPLSEKHITSEVCVHHLFFDEAYYYPLGNKIKCNPAIKAASDREALLDALKAGYLDVIATDHAPHTIEEKSKHYFEAPSGLPLVQHALTLMLDFYHRGELGIEFIVDKMSHKVAELFQIKDRGYIDEGSYADLIIVDPNKSWTIDKSNIAYKCGWSPLEGFIMKGKVISTMCNGQWVYKDEKLTEVKAGQRLLFNRD